MYKYFIGVGVIGILLISQSDRASAQGWPPKNGATLPSTCSPGEIYFITTSTTTQLYRCTATNTWISQESPDSIRKNVKEFGAKCDGITDDSVALQAAFDAADATDVEFIVQLPPTTCRFATPLVIGNRPTGGPYSHVSVEGVSEDLSKLEYVGSNDQAVFQIRHVAYFTMSKFNVFRSGPKGTSIGILLDCSTISCGGGTMTLTGTFSHIGVSGFDVGMQIGSTNAAASEIWCHHCNFTLNNTGVTSFSFNTLNIWFTAVGLGANGCGMSLNADAVHIQGGHSYGNSTADFCKAGFGNLSINKFRAEVATKFIDNTGSAVDFFTLRDSLLTHSDPNTVTINITGGFVHIENNDITGKVSYKPGGTGEVIMINNHVTESLPLGPLSIVSGGQSANIKLRNNRNNDSQLKRFQDLDGLVSFAEVSPIIETRSAWVGTGEPPGGGVYIRAVRGIAYGSPDVRGENLRDRVTFASSGTAAYTFTKTVSVTTTANSATISFASGAIHSADIGKTIVVPDVLTNCSGTPEGPEDDWFGRIRTIASATTATVFPSTWIGFITDGYCAQDNPDQSETQIATIGTDEPDTNYLIVGLSCNAQETFSWSSKSTTGFTLTSSNPSSTATCEFMIVR